MLKSRRHRAFTLTEFVVATAILLIGVSQIFDQFQKTNRPSKRYESIARARMLGHQLLEELRVIDIDELRQLPAVDEYQVIEVDKFYRYRIRLTELPGEAVEIEIDVKRDDDGSLMAELEPAAKGTRVR